MCISAQSAPFLDALTAYEPDREYLAELNLFGQFVGSWHLEVKNFPEEGPVVTAAGEWHFARVLDGRAIQDVWIVPRRDRIAAGAAVTEYGTTLRVFDPSIGAWRSTWFGPVRNRVLPFIGREENGEIVLSREESDGELTRWIFFEIATRSFRWRADTSTDGGKTWRTEQEMRVWRIEE